MTYILIFAGLFLIFILGVYFQGSREVRNAQLKDIGIISHYKGKPFTGTTVEKDGSKCDYVEGLKHGLDTTVIDGTIYCKINYENDKPKGISEFFGLKGDLIARGNFDIKTTGTWNYYQNGKLFKIEENPQLDLEKLIKKRITPLRKREERFKMLLDGYLKHFVQNPEDFPSTGDVIQGKTNNKFYLLNAQEAAFFDYILSLEKYIPSLVDINKKNRLFGYGGGLFSDEINLNYPELDDFLDELKLNENEDARSRYRALSWFEDSNPELFKKLFDLNDTASKALERFYNYQINSTAGELKKNIEEEKAKVIALWSENFKITFDNIEFKEEQDSKYIPKTEKSSNPVPKWFKTIDISEIDLKDFSDEDFNNPEEYQVYNFLNEIRTQIKEDNLDFNDLLNNSNYSEIKEAREMCLNWFKKHNKELYKEFKDQIIKSDEKDDDLISKQEDQDSVQELESLSLDSRSMHAFDVFKSRNPGLEKICNKELTKIWDDFFLWCYAQNAFIMRGSGAEEAIRSYSNYDLKITSLMQEALDEIGSQWERNSIDHQTEAEEECRNECGEEDCEWPDFNPDCESCGGLGYFQYDHWKSYELTIQNIIKGIDKNNFHKLSEIKL